VVPPSSAIASDLVPSSPGSPEDVWFVLDATCSSERACWLELWSRWPDREVWGHPDYVKLFAEVNHRPLCVGSHGPRGTILFPLILRPLSELAWATGYAADCDLISPYGYGGPFMWGQPDVPKFWSSFVAWSRQIHAVSLFARYSLFEEQLAPLAEPATVAGQCVVVPVDLPVEVIWRGYEKAARENIRQAQRAGIVVEQDTSCRRLDEFLRVYYETMDRLVAPRTYYFTKEFFYQLVQALQGSVVMFHALQAGRVVSSELLLVAPERAYAFLGGTVTDALHLRCNQLLRHEVNVWARDAGKRHVVLGGGRSAGDNLFRYKKKFAPLGTRPFRVGRFILQESAYQRLVLQRREWHAGRSEEWLPEPEFFPAYRA